MYSLLRKLKIVSFILLSFSLKVSAPCWKSLTIYKLVPDEPYKRLIFATGMVESKSDTLAYNSIEAAAGIFQIRPIRLIDYNKRTGSHIARKDLFNYKTSEKIFLFYAEKVGPYNFEQIARKWNGSGHLTIAYWDRIKHYL